MHDLDVGDTLEHLGQRGHEPGIDLDGHDACDRRRERQREGPEPRADLQDDVIRVQVGGEQDPSDGVRVDEQMLSRPLARRQSVPIEQLTGAARGQQLGDGSSPRAGTVTAVLSDVRSSARRPSPGAGGRVLPP
jgi:hypothetical protein